MLYPLYREPFCPQFHFTPERNWMNDPNGMVYHQGEYHLFYQYNSFGDKWGHMSWGHAISSDLVHWHHLPVALAEEGDLRVYSGSAVVDFANSSGFGQAALPWSPSTRDIAKRAAPGSGWKIKDWLTAMTVDERGHTTLVIRSWISGQKPVEELGILREEPGWCSRGDLSPPPTSGSTNSALSTHCSTSR